jgi:hypothetical protein
MKSLALCYFAIAAIMAGKPEFHWNSRDAQELNWKQNIRASKLIAVKRKALVTAVSAQLQTKDILNTRIKEIDLNGDGKPEIIAQATDDNACSPTGNCPFWVFQWSRDHYNLLLKSQAQTFTIQPLKTSGAYDLVLGFHGSATNTKLTEYKFDGEVYRSSGCYEANWSYFDKKGELHELKEPRITACDSNKS